VETLRDFQRRMSGHLIELYGMLETGYHTYTRLIDDPEKVNGTIGRCVKDMGLRLLDPAGTDVPRGEQGEIACDGPSVHLGYYNNPQANAEAFTADGWFRTGDLGVIADEAGNVRIVGRSKEIINRGGKKFFPREVEEILYTHPKVLHVAMVGVADARLGERNCLCIVPKGGAQVTLEEFNDFLRGQVATYKLPERLEIFSELPFTPTGKIQRFLLQKEIETRDRAAARAVP
jgi:acyl-CoA synthetase (AMP-forming)/AMP-acid ligase II